MTGKRKLINKAVSFLTDNGYQEIEIPIIQFQETFKDKIGYENNNLMFNFEDRKEREICL